MEQPNIPNRFTLKIGDKEIKLNIVAYRKLTTEEKTDQIDLFLKDRKTPKLLKNYKGKEIIIITLYGINDPINPFERF